MTDDEKREEFKAKFSLNKELSKDDPNRAFWANRSKDPYQDEVDKINDRINKAKALTPSEMKAIENTLAQQDIQKNIFRSQMMMKSDEALQKQKIPRKEPELTEKEKFIARFKNKDKDHER